MMLVLIFCLSVINAFVYAAGGFENFTDRNHYTANTFQDVKKSDWFYTSVVTVYEKGLMNGKGNSRFDPDGYVTVAEAVTVAARLHTLYNTGNESFGTAALWYEPYCKYAEKHGIIRRYSTNGITHEGAIEEKREEDNVTRYWSTACTDNASRAFFASVLAKSLPTQALASINDLADDSLPDVVMTDQYAEEIYALYRAGVITGSDAYGTFKPDYRITAVRPPQLLLG